MNWLAIERGAWTLSVGGFLAVLLGALVSPRPDGVGPYAVGSLAVGLPVAHWFVGRQLGDFPAADAGRLTTFFLALFAVSYVGFLAVEFAVASGGTVVLLARAGAVVVALSVSRRAATAGYDRFRVALSE
ncbi:hypothetical protein NGM10_06105 [Halorussus salilacus]|uniref:hypothetical protein n=1 Tax=Halorussus salilacus TaxID=2953750 RepID=UPI00209CE87E|nr:hypothetical protein [Halorussus salilacus]USZ69307.1 hypothetical protein NGM10_06105 [Halorussus salilacus]